MEKPEETHREPLPPRMRRTLVLLYASGALGWSFLVALTWGAFQFTYAWIAILVPFVVCGVNIFLTIQTKTSGSFPMEVERIEEVELHGSHMIAAVLGTLVVAAGVVAIGGGVKLSPGFLELSAFTLVLAVGGIMPFYWIPSDKPSWLLMLRHVKGVFLAWSIGFFLAAIITLIQTILEATPSTP